MAQIKFFSAFDMRTFASSGTSFHDRITGGNVSAGADLVRVVNGEVTRDDFYGAGLGGISQNMPTTGTINEWATYTAPSAGSAYSLIWDLGYFSVAASTVADYVLSDRVDLLLSLHVMNGDDTVWGSDSSDGLLGYSGTDTFYAGDGNDYINGGSGADVMYGEDGDDTYIVDNAGDVVDENIMDLGNDTVVLVSNLGGSEYVAGTYIENLRNGSGLSGWLSGNSLGNNLTGANGVADTLDGKDGNDVLDGGSGGADAMYGGAGDDVFIVDNSADFVTDKTKAASTGSGLDEVRASVTYSLNDAARTDIENLRLTGTAAINATGNALANVLTGNAGANILNGLSGADTMSGGDGNDTYYVDSSADKVIESSASGGSDRVVSSLTYQLGTYIENLTLGGGDEINGSGNGLGNQMVGNGAANILSGRDGNDFLYGNGGNDALYGGNGIDQLSGGTGDDWIEGGAGQDDLTGGADADSFVFRAGDFAGLTAGSCDRVRDFSQAQSDQIRLNAIDANSANGSGTNEAFTFIGTAAFHHVAGELRYQVINGNTYVYGDTDGNAVADFLIRLDGTVALSAADFLL